LAYLYPSEDARLMACTEVPIEYRMLWGFLTREGMRVGEALTLSWRDLDLGRGAVKLDRNKTDDPRAWALSPGVVRALRRFAERYRPDAAPDSLVFTEPNGGTFVGYLLPKRLRAHLASMGLKRERPELFSLYRGAAPAPGARPSMHLRHRVAGERPDRVVDFRPDRGIGRHKCSTGTSARPGRSRSSAWGISWHSTKLCRSSERSP
jgi:integrase